MHPEVVDNEPGKCPICTMSLVQVRLALVWTCQVHTTVARLEAGTCPTCRRDLVRVIRAMTWTCPVHTKVSEIGPGRCPTCKRALVVRYAERPHGDHNPKHGGYFFMAPNNWHVEVTHPSRGLFRLYAYDEYSKPFLPKGLAATLTIPASALRAGSAESTVRFAPAAGARYLEARVPDFALPAVVIAKVRFHANEPEYRFDFHFFEYSKEPR
jgi:ribosomal protein L37AE/L43A